MCNHCTYSETDPQIDCAVCFGRLCKGLGTDQTQRSICHKCIVAMNANNSFQYDEYGRGLDPATRRPLKTCTCGKVVHKGLSPCVVAWMTGSMDHRPVVN